MRKLPGTKLTFTLFVSLGLNVASLAQVNETDPSLYMWKEGRTVIAPGYVVIRSGARLEGAVQLDGSIDQVAKVIFTRPGSDPIEFLPSSLNAYGLIVGNATGETLYSDPINNSPMELYKWGVMSESSGHVYRSTRWQSGHVLLRDGQDLDGELKLTYVDDKLDQLSVRSGTGERTDLEPVHVSRYGLKMNVNDDKKKKHKDPVRNFNRGKVTRTDGTVLSGFVAMACTGTLNLISGRCEQYAPIYFAPDEAAFITSIPAAEVRSVEIDLPAGRAGFQNYRGVMVANDLLLDATDSRDRTLDWQPGYIILSTGERFEGRVQQIKPAMKWYATAVNYADSSGHVKEYAGNDVQLIAQMIDSVDHRFLREQDVLVELEVEGPKFCLFRNPFPGARHELLNELTRYYVTTTADTLAKVAAENNDLNRYGEDADKNGIVDGKEASAEPVSADRNAQMVRDLGASGAGLLDFKKREYILWDKERNQRTIFDRSKYADAMDSYLNGCADYLTMTAEQKKPYLQWEGMKKAVELVNKCY